MSRKYPITWMKELILLKKEIIEKIKQEKNSVFLLDEDMKIISVKSNKYYKETTKMIGKLLKN